MRRRAFITAMGGAIMWPLAARAQQEGAPARSVTRILVINPNSSQATTDMMVRIAQSAASDGVEIIGATATKGPRMIVEPAALTASAAEVVEIGMRLAGGVAGIIVSAFGDPGMRDLQARVGVPVVGIAESSMLEAASGDSRFGVATTTPELVAAIDARAADLGLASLYTGVRLTSGDPVELARHPDDMTEALGKAVLACIELDGAKAVIIGGGPLGNAATALTPRFAVPVIAPIPAAVHRVQKLMH
jgi:Asp/Glu/hydantoin racemase